MRSVYFLAANIHDTVRKFHHHLTTIVDIQQLIYIKEILRDPHKPVILYTYTAILIVKALSVLCSAV